MRLFVCCLLLLRRVWCRCNGCGRVDVRIGLRLEVLIERLPVYFKGFLKFLRCFVYGGAILIVVFGIIESVTVEQQVSHGIWVQSINPTSD